jgi:hypothetical protein
VPHIVSALDVSNYQTANIGQLLETFQPEHVIVRLSTESPPKRDIARAQLEQALDFGATVSGYVWCYWNLDPNMHTHGALSVAEGFPIKRVWFDCEDDSGADQARVELWLATGVQVAADDQLPSGIYTGQFWWQDFAGNTDAFNDLPLWLARYDDIATLDFPHKFGGWTQLAGKQWTDKPTDQNVFSSEFI